MTVPISRLAYMDLLRGFVAVGRRMSITAAADDLCLTQSAVSRQVHALEKALGVKLFERHNRSISFTAEGERLFRSADSALQQLQDAVGVITGARERKPVTVSASIGMAGLWLLPRLGRFQELHPRLDVRVAAENKIADLRADGIDIAIRYCAKEAAPEGAVHMFDESVAPVASPMLGLDRLDAAHSVHGRPLLEFDDVRRPWLQWGEWLGAQGWGQARASSVIRFNQYDQVIHAAIAGQGLALGRLELLDHFLKRDQLRILHARRHAPALAYGFWLVQAEAQPRAEVQRVVDWILGEAETARDRIA